MNEGSNNKNIRDLLRDITNDKTAQIYSVAVKITAVDETARTCDCEPLNGDPEFFDVRLQSVISGADGFVLIPAVDSVGIVTFVNNTTGYLATCSKIDKMIVKSDVEILIDCEDIKFNGGSNGGLIKINDLVSKLNAVEQKVNDLITACSSVVVALAPAGTFPLASFFTSVTPLTPTQTTDIENDKIKH
jgi:hypothetical protein